MKVESEEYVERVYAGVLGKVIGVMMGKPFEGWDYERIVEKFGVIDGYVHDRVDYPLVCTDDDTSGTFTFLRAIEDNGFPPIPTSSQIGRTWLNYLVEGRSVLWWGGIGTSTEHTAYLRLLNGIQAPASGSERLNGKRVSEQIGAQIFIDGWAMVCPGDTERAVALAIQAAEVSHDGESVLGARALAAMEALAFDETDIGRLVECGLSHVRPDSTIAQIIRDVREWAAANGDDWQATRTQVEAKYGAKQYGVGHIFPNHALIHLALWHGKGDFAKSLSIVNTCGWDTDCNSGNLGCLLGIRNGLAGIPKGLRQPMADRMYLPTADSGRGITDCLREAMTIVNVARGWRGLPPISKPRFSFSQVDAVQGFGGAPLSNHDAKGLEIEYSGEPSQILTPTFIPPNLPDMHGYELTTSPMLYPGQKLSANLRSDVRGLEVALTVRTSTPERTITSQWTPIDCASSLDWTVPAIDAEAIDVVGISLRGGTTGAVILESLDWTGVPETDLLAPSIWVKAIDDLQWWSKTMVAIQNHGRGMALAGCREWTDYEIESIVVLRLGTLGVCARVQGLRRYVAAIIDAEGFARIVAELDGERVLASGTIKVRLDLPLRIRLRVAGNEATAWFGDVELVGEIPTLLNDGGVAVLCEDGRADFSELQVHP